MRAEDWQRVRRLLAVRLDNIGDIVMLTPALRSLRRALPEAHIALLASPAGAGVAPLIPWLDQTLVLRALWQDTRGALPFDPARELALTADLCALGFDAALVFTSFSQSPFPPAYLCYLAGIGVRVGQSKEFGGGVLSTAVLPPPDHLHQVDRNLHLVTTCGIPSAGAHLELSVPPPARTTADCLLAALGIRGDYALIAPGASCSARRWPVARFAALARALACDLPVVVIGHEREAALATVILDACRGRAVHSLVGSTTLPETAALLARARLLVANNSGSLHLADALGCPMVILYAGTELESQWRPRFAPAVVLRQPTACSPCYRFECPTDHECLDIDPAHVLAAARSLLAASGSRTATPDLRGEAPDPARLFTHPN